MNLKLTRPLVFFDLEATGVDVATDRIVEIAILKVQPDGSEELMSRRVNPTIPIPKEASEVHHIYDEDVAHEKTFREQANEFVQFIGNSDLAGYNSNRYDVPLLMEEFLRAEVDFDIEKRRLIDVQNIFHKMEQRTLSAAYKFYCSKSLDDAHQAEADTRATFEILQAQLERYHELNNDTDFLHEFSSRTNSADLMGRIIYDDQGVEIFNFGKHKGKKVVDVLQSEPSYYSWMMNNDFPLYTKKVLTKIKLRSFNQ